MAIPLKVQLFDSFLGTQEGIHSIILPDIFSSGGSKNLYIDKFGRAKKILGYSRTNASPVLVTGAAPSLVRGLVEYKATGGGTTVRQLLGVFDSNNLGGFYELWMSVNDGATWTFVAQMPETWIGDNPSVGKIPDFVQFGDNLYITNGAFAPKKWDGSTLSAAGRTRSPTPTSVLGSAGNLSGTYNYKLLSMVGGTRQAGSVASTTLSVQAKQVALSWSQDSNTAVTGYEIYRTTGTGAVYYFTDYVDGRATVAYNDNIGDLSLLENRVMAEHGDPPPVVYFCAPHKQRVWWGRTDTYPTRVYWSDPGLPEDVLGDNYLDFSDSETVGDVVTGMVGNFEGRLIVFTEKAVWTVSGTGQIIGNIVDWTRVHTNAQIGSVSHRTAVRIPAGAKYSDQEGKLQQTNVVTVAYMTPLGDIRIFDGENDTIVSNPVRTSLSGLNYSARATAFALTDSQRGEISWHFPTGTSGVPSTAVVWNYRWGVWYVRDWAFGCAVEADTASSSSTLFAGSNSTTTGGVVYKLWDGNSFNGTAINAVWMTKTLYGVNIINYQGQPAISHTKKFRWIDIVFETESSASLDIAWLSGTAQDNGTPLGSANATPIGEMLADANGKLIQTANGSFITVGGQSATLRVLLKDVDGRYPSDTGIRLRISDNASNGSWSLEAMSLAYQIIPGLQRRMGIGD